MPGNGGGGGTPGMPGAGGGGGGGGGPPSELGAGEASGLGGGLGGGSSSTLGITRRSIFEGEVGVNGVGGVSSGVVGTDVAGDSGIVMVKVGKSFKSLSMSMTVKNCYEDARTAIGYY